MRFFFSLFSFEVIIKKKRVIKLFFVAVINVKGRIAALGNLAECLLNC